MTVLNLRNKKAPLWSLFVGLLFCVSFLQAGQKVAIATAHPLATDAGWEVLQKGGNAFDAAVAVSAALAVVEPYSSGIGGGGFWLLHRASDGKNIMLDGREKAPLKAHRDMYLDEHGEVIKGLSIDGPLAAGIPGEPAALAHLAKHYGQLPLSVSLKPAIELAQNGIAVDEIYRKMAGWRLAALQDSESASDIFLVDDAVPETGVVIKQPELAATLQLLAEKGRDGFYKGQLAQKLVKGVGEAGGIWSMQDLAEYKVIEREPVVFNYLDKKIVSATLPSSGGVVLAQTLGMLEAYELNNKTAFERTHLVVEAMKRAYRERAIHLGDMDFVKVPLQKLTDKTYARQLGADIHLTKASSSADLDEQAEGMDTTHFSILDAEGNRVAATLSINYPFGSGFVVPGTGVLLNDEMDDFSSKPGTPNVYGLVGAEANAIAPGKRMLSSMTPTFVESDKGIAILGTPGGSRIISMVLLGILELEQTTNPQDWVSLPRFHHQYLPDVIQFEPGAFDDGLQQELLDAGHKLKSLENSYGNMQAIYLDKKTGEVSAASDPRGIGKAISADSSDNKNSSAGQE